MKLITLLSLAVSAASAINTNLQKPILAPSSSVQEIPPIGFGTWNLKPDDHNASNAVEHAIKSGYRHIDCAAVYGNEKDVGRGIRKGLKAAGLHRKDIWVTSKLWNDHHDAAQVPKGLARTLKDLDLEYLDLYLMHWPVAKDADGNNSIKFIETWKAMELLVHSGLVRHIGISNFSPAQLRSLLSAASIRPYAHQLEHHPYLPQSAWLQYHYSRGIRITAYSPLGNSNPTYHKDTSKEIVPLLQHPTVVKIAEERNCTPATVALAWGVGRGVSVVPKSQHKEHIEDNLRAAECEAKLEFEDVRALQRIGMRNLTRFNNPSKGWGLSLYEGLEDA